LVSRQVRKLLYSAKVKNPFVDIKEIINSAVSEYYQLAETWRQENFVIAVSVIYYLHDREDSPDFLFTWLFELLQHPNGYIRHSAVRMINNELGPLSVFLRFPKDKRFLKDRLSPKKADQILFSLFISLCGLSDITWLPKYKKYKYIDELPPSPYKSAQLLLADMEDMCGKEYLDNLAKNIGDKK